MSPKAILSKSLLLVVGLALWAGAAYSGEVMDADAVSGLGTVELVGQIGGGCSQVEIDGTYAYLNEGYNLPGIDVSNPDEPVPSENYDGLSIFDASVFGSLIYTAVNGYGLCTLGHAEIPTMTPAPTGVPGNMRLWGQVGGACKDIEIQGNYAYIGNGPNLMIVDVSTPEAPYLAGQAFLPGLIMNLSVSNGFVYAVYTWDEADDGGLGLQIVDVTSPSAPVMMGNLPCSTWTSLADVAVFGSMVYMTHQSGISVIDVSDPGNPIKVRTLDLYHQAGILAVSGSKLYAAVNSTITIFTLSNPASPGRIHEFNATVEDIKGFTVSDSTLYVWFFSRWCG